RLFDIPYYQLENFPKQDAFCTKVNGQWVKTSTAEFIEQVNYVSAGLIQLGIQKGDKVGLVSSNNRTEWNIVDIAILQIGAIDVPVYPTITEADNKFIFNDAEVKFCFVSDSELSAKINNIKDEIPSLNEIYTFDTVEGAKSWKEILEAGKTAGNDTVQERKSDVEEQDLATLIYTSGTTGTPKGVMLSHKNIVSNAKACNPMLPIDEHSRALSFLPACHIYERMMHYMFMYIGVSIYFAETLDTIGENLKEVKPHGFTAVPRLLEKVYDSIVNKGKELTGIKKKLFFWALDLGHRYELNGANGWWYELQLALARKIIFIKWKEGLGGNVGVIASGSAALQPRLARVFTAAGIPIMEGYGLTETSPVVSVNSYHPNGVMFGTVGKLLRDVEVKIAEDGEILIKGPCLMMGYYKRDDLTKKAIDEDGWFHSGDIGEMVNGEFLKITDRKKEIFKTSGGKYVAPQVIENKLKQSFFIEQVIVIGEYQKHPAALIVPSFEFLKKWCVDLGMDTESNKEIIKDEIVIHKIKEEVHKINKEFGSWEQIKKFELLDREWTVEDGELTPTLKLKRKNILNNNRALFNKIYELEEPLN
ncbi:MAG TPA: long-chain fatty acid--CoA ligase, partial [Flavobacteriales bacterium]|nr:long-chain fatty acid--CoA ligase [Flavobacteriales bacterium]